ncbi:MAG: protein-glutamate O-methyltransferase CheR [Syntrophorhabdaceae bacterium]|nr:protein-glutamate O-methyltransferase CheR [Syntrophorhabdaceae bacterium]
MTQQAPLLNDKAFEKLRDYVYDRSGIRLSEIKKHSIENHLARRILENHLSGFDDYLTFMMSREATELKALFGIITTNETYFFREPPQLDVFKKHIVPNVLKNKRTRDIRVWSAACSSGEEPYTVAAMLKETEPLLRTDIIGSDISEVVLETARRGIFSSYSVRNVPPNYLQKYFKARENAYELDESIRKMVRFLNVNLVDEKAVRAIRNADVIFCRNVLIYFDEKSKRKAVSLLYDALAPNGFLIVGTSESLYNVTRALQPTVIDKVVLYQKAGS